METAARSLPFTFAQQYGVLLEDAATPVVLHRDDLPLTVLTELRRFLAGPYTLEKVADGDFQRRLTLAYQRDNNEASQVAEDLSADIDLSRLAEEIPELGDLMDAEDDAPIIRLINAVLSQAVREKASDIHIETFEEKLSVRYRIDGVLAEVLSPKRMLAPLLVSRLKVMAKLDIAEKRVPQDGRISVRIAGHAVDIRMSTIPSAHGERVVLRLLDKQAGQLHLEQLHMNESVLAGYCRGLATPHGIILVTGPTGSGKTTTLYAGLTHINEASRNILTIEDPVEYMLPGIGQTQVNTKVEMTFARGLRAILRQDPDVVMVGEIRDLETAEIAVQASLTGHLVLSTLHTNTAIGAVTRLQDMGIEPFLLSSSLIGVMAQRLVRLLCTECREPRQATAVEAAWLGETQAEIYRPVGCEHCKDSGYKGRTGIYELIEVTDALRAMIHSGASETAMIEQARKESPGILQDGQRRVLSGETSMEEVMRVTSAA
ncbi:type II secretion system protein GspE [Halieaceae bacterium IMCC14734]|uniref:Type II secretion system protein E n=1 Tax=Candidatus Litorirhabdus singularis TaxID=2518993 RepID=A0ABT3TFF3_9GAMM|nr:type II secretion system ATPase GspE [Candidatus Litorirhabdus singularis]MCX2981042.1 type II secretion system protein GspE [Candidatus Litorirhabdus singularis]